MIFNRSLIGGSLLRATGSTYQMRDDGTVSNLYNLELLNKSGKDISFEIEPQSDNFKIQLVNSISNLEKDGAAKMSFFIIGNPKDVKKYKTDIKVLIKSDNKVIETLKTTFISPPGA